MQRARNTEDAGFDRLMVFTGNAHPRLAEDVVRHLNINLGRAKVGRFSDGEVTVDMGRPSSPVTEKLNVQGRAVEATILSMGNPHAVQLVPDVASAPVSTQGPMLEVHPRFPQRVNAGYMQVLDRHHIALRVWERGAGETLSCGTGACAAVVAGIARGLLDSPVRVETRGGTLTIAWAGGDNPVSMKGPAATVFEGTIEL